MSGALYKVNLLNDTIGSIDVINGGTGYNKTPKIYIDSPMDFNGRVAKAYCNVINGSIDSIILTDNGSGYTSVPNIIDDYNMNSGDLQMHSGWDSLPTINNDDSYRIIGSHHLKSYLTTLRNDYELSILAGESSTLEFSHNGIINIYDNYDNFLYGSCSSNSNPQLYTYNNNILCYGYKNDSLNGLFIQNLSSLDKLFKIIIFS